MNFFETAVQLIPLLFVALAFNIRAFSSSSQEPHNIGRPADYWFHAFPTVFSVTLLAAAEWVSIETVRSGHIADAAEHFVLSALALASSMIVAVIVGPHVRLIVDQWVEATHVRRLYISLVTLLALSPLIIASLLAAA